MLIPLYTTFTPIVTAIGVGMFHRSHRKDKPYLPSEHISGMASDYEDAMIRVASRVDGPMTVRGYDENKDVTDPSIDAIQNHFSGTWDEIKLQLGLELSGHNDAYTTDEIDEALIAADDRNEGESMSINAYEDLREPDDPPGPYIAAKLGWNNVKRRNGLSVTYQGGSTTEHISYDDDGYVRALRFAASVTPKDSLSREAYREIRKAHPERPMPSAGSVVNRYEYWNEAKRAAGLETF